MTTGAILLAAGSGTRLGLAEKAFARLESRPMLSYSLEVFLKSEKIDRIAIVAKEAMFGEAERIVSAMNPGKSVVLAGGGATRQESVISGLAALGSGIDCVLVHDAARPFVTKDLVLRAIDSAAKFGSGVAARRMTDTVKEATPSLEVAKTLCRDGLWAAETPQAFSRALLSGALLEAQKKGVSYSDDAGAVEAAGGKVRLVESFEPNFKITYPKDMQLAACLIRLNGEKGKC